MDIQAQILDTISGASEVYQISEYKLSWQAPSGATVGLMLTIKDAGSTLGRNLRYSCEARRLDGKAGRSATGRAIGNNGPDLESALSGLAVHLQELDVD